MVNSMEQQILSAHKQYLESLIKAFSKMSEDDDKAFALMLRAVTRFTNISVLDICAQLGVSPMIIERWSSETTVPLEEIFLPTFNGVIQLLLDRIAESKAELNRLGPAELPEKYKPRPTPKMLLRQLLGDEKFQTVINESIVCVGDTFTATLDGGSAGKKVIVVSLSERKIIGQQG